MKHINILFIIGYPEYFLGSNFQRRIPQNQFLTV